MTKILWKSSSAESIVVEHCEDEEVDITAEDLKHNGLLLKHVIKHTEDLCLTAVKQNANALIYAKCLTEQVMLAAVKQKGSMIKYIKNPSDIICKAAVTQDPNALEYIKYQSEEIILIAVEKSAIAAKYIKKPSLELYKKLININLNSYSYMDMNEAFITEEFIEDIWKKLLCNDGMKLENCRKQTSELCKYAIEQNPHAVQYIRPSIFTYKEYVTLLEIAVIKNSDVIQYILDQVLTKTDLVNLVKIALTNNGLSLKHFSNMIVSYKLCKIAVNQNKGALVYIKNTYFKSILDDSLYTKSNREIDDCIVCYSSNKYFIKTFVCNHIYCRDCIVNNTMKKCPMCRESREISVPILIKK
jgi:hypothetical protein